MRTKLKICGITNFEDALSATKAGVDWLGFNFYPKSPRYINPIDAGKIILKLKNTIQSVAILVQPSLSDVSKIIKESGVDRLQIYEPVDFNDLSIFSIPTIISYRIDNSGGKINYPMLKADMILFDSYSKDVLGGSGHKFNWELIPPDISREKLILAGGITPENISEALNTVNPTVIDVASGAEISPGKKNINKIKSMVMEIRKYNENS